MDRSNVVDIHIVYTTEKLGLYLLMDVAGLDIELTQPADAELAGRCILREGITTKCNYFSFKLLPNSFFAMILAM